MTNTRFEPDIAFGVLSIALLCGGMVYLASCSPATQQRVVAAGQLFCAKATKSGPLIVALADAAGAPVVVTGMTAAAVQANCAIINAVPVIPPPDPVNAPVVAVAAPFH